MHEVSPPAYAGPPPGSPEQVRAILAELRRLYPDAKISLTFSNPLELLVATQLSAQSTDERVNLVTAELFKKYRRVEDYATVSQEEVEQDLMRIVPRKDWLHLPSMLISHGRAICRARKPLCAQCGLVSLCPSAFLVS